MGLSQETQCTTTAVFNKMEDIPNSMLCVSMKRGLSIIEDKLEVTYVGDTTIHQLVVTTIHYFSGTESADHGKSCSTVVILRPPLARAQ